MRLALPSLMFLIKRVCGKTLSCSQRTWIAMSNVCKPISSYVCAIQIGGIYKSLLFGEF